MLGRDLFDRKHEITVSRDLASARNRMLTSGQWRMEKTSLIRELSRQLEKEGWVTFFMDVEGASSPENCVSNAARNRVYFCVQSTLRLVACSFSGPLCLVVEKKSVKFV